MRDYPPYDAAELAMNFTTKAIQATVEYSKINETWRSI